MRKAILILIGITVLILENSIFNYIKVFGISANISIVYVCIVSLFVKDNEGALIGIILGILKDILVGSIFGINGLVYFIIGYMYGKLRDKIFKERIITVAILVYFAIVFQSIANLFVLNDVFNNSEFIYALIKSLIISPMINVFVGAIVNNWLVEFVKKLEFM